MTIGKEEIAKCDKCGFVLKYSKACVSLLNEMDQMIPIKTIELQCPRCKKILKIKYRV